MFDKETTLQKIQERVELEEAVLVDESILVQHGILDSTDQIFIRLPEKRTRHLAKYGKFIIDNNQELIYEDIFNLGHLHDMGVELPKEGVGSPTLTVKSISLKFAVRRIIARYRKYEKEALQELKVEQLIDLVIQHIPKSQRRLRQYYAQLKKLPVC